MYLSAVSLRTSHSLSFYWYLWCDAVWVRGLWQLTLQSGTWIVCCSVQSNNVFVSYCQMPYTPPFIFLCSIFCTTAKIRPTFRWQVGEYMGIQNQKSGKAASHHYRNNGLVLCYCFIDEWPHCTSIMVWNDVAKQDNQTKNSDKSKKCHVGGNTNINVSILHELCSENVTGCPQEIQDKVDSGLLQLCTVVAVMMVEVCAASCNSPAWKPDLKQICYILERLSRMLFIESSGRGGFLSVACCISL